jgi:hypothetical protein
MLTIYGCNNGMQLFLKLLWFSELIILLLLTSFLLAHFSVSIVPGMQHASQQNSIYQYSMNSALILKPTTYGSGIYTVVYSTTEVVQKDHDTISADTTQRSDPRDSAVITMQRNGTANGLFPIYSLTIYGNGSVIYKGIKNVETSGIQTYQIPKDRARELVNGFINIYYFALKDKYSDSSNASNLPVVTTSINMDGKTKTVLDNHSSYAPAPLRALEDKIDQLTNSKQWIEHQ